VERGNHQARSACWLGPQRGRIISLRRGTGRLLTHPRLQGQIWFQDRDEEKIIAWQARIAELIDEQRRETMIGEKLWGAYQAAGGTGINASTGQEITRPE